MKKKYNVIKGLLILSLSVCTVFTSVPFVDAPHVVEAFTQKMGYVTGEEVNVRENAGTGNKVVCTLKMGHEVKVVGEAVASNNAIWYKIEFTLDGENKSGYIHSNYIRTVLPNVSADEDPGYEEYLSVQQFPESYRVYLRALHKLHPKWTFVAVPTTLTWGEVVENESKLGANLVPAASISSWKSLAEGAYDWNTNEWIGKDGSKWVSASPSVVKYYLDPRNFLRENSQILQFESLRYIEGEQTKEGLANILKGTFMENEDYYNAFMEAGKASGVNPYHLASRCRQEVGVSGSNSTYDVKVDNDKEKYSDFNGFYNYFNIGASPSAEHDSMYNGLARAKAEGWDSPEKSIKGGATFLAEKYINVNQDTLYLQKFDVVDGGNGLYWHQYMTNLEAAASEANLMKKAYADLDEASVTYYVPVYLEMPDYSFDKPDYDGSVRCVLSDLKIEGYELTREFDPYVTNYTVKGKVDVDSIFVSAKAFAQDATISGAGQIKIDKSAKDIKVTCKGSDNATLTYTINIDGSLVEQNPGIVITAGDVNCDGTVNVSDAKLVLENVVGITALSEKQISLADVNEDGLVDINDVLRILKFVSGESESL